jgi:hypothetical protein
MVANHPQMSRPSLLAQTPSLGGVEGPISAIVNNGDGSVTLTVMGMTVVIPPTATVASPSKPLTFAEIIDTTPLAGRTAPGWVGATAKGTGTTSPEGVLTIEDVIFEPAENVVIGIITGTQPLTVNHMPVEMSTDPRIPASTVNELGFEIDLAQATVGQSVAIGGHYSGGVFHAFEIEVTGAPARNPALQVTSLRAQGRAAKGELQIQGSLSGIAAGAVAPTVRFSNELNGSIIGSVVVVLDPLAPGTASFRYRGRGLAATQVPATVRMTVLDANGQPTAATSTTDVDLR